MAAALIAKAAVGAARVMGSAARAATLDIAAGIAGAAEYAAGRRGHASLPVRVLILSDEKGRPLCRPESVAAALARADQVFTAGAGIRVRVDGVRTVTEPAPTRVLDPRSNRLLLLDDVLGRTEFFRRRLPPRDLLSVVADPVTVVVVRDISGRTTGCSLGMSADWVICQASLFDPADPRHYDETVLAHELGHALNLPHLRDPGNLMYPTSTPPDKLRGTALRSWQAALLRANRHTAPPAGSAGSLG